MFPTDIETDVDLPSLQAMPRATTIKLPTPGRRRVCNGTFEKSLAPFERVQAMSLSSHIPIPQQ